MHHWLVNQRVMLEPVPCPLSLCLTPLSGDPAPVKMFDRNEHLAGTQVISYAASADGHWLMVVGIKAGAPGGPAVGCMQLYSVEKRVSQPLDAHAGCFTTAKLPGRADTAILFCFVQKKPVRFVNLMLSFCLWLYLWLRAPLCVVCGRESVSMCLGGVGGGRGWGVVCRMTCDV